MQLRNAQPRDYTRVSEVLNAWWGGRQMREMLPKLFFVHFRDTSFVMEAGDELAGFLCGFLSQTYPSEAYIHFVGVNPRFRKMGIARQLYEKFFAVVRERGIHRVRAVTAPINATSIAFHRALGFEIEPGDAEQDGVSVHTNYDGRGEDRVLFVKEWQG
jgi:ribosomal protein S18 acetylase RimI-like enzyme